MGNASFLSALHLQRNNASLKTDSLATRYLDNDFLSYTLARMLGPEIIKPIFFWVPFWGDRAAALEHAMDYPGDRDSLMGKVIRGDIAQLIPTKENNYPILCINTTKVNDGGPGVVSTINLDSSDVKIKRKNIRGRDSVTVVDTGRILAVVRMH